MSEVTSPKYAGVDVDHPRIVEYIRNMLKQGEKKEKIAKVVGMPLEVVDRVERDFKK